MKINKKGRAQNYLVLLRLKIYFCKVRNGINKINTNFFNLEPCSSNEPCMPEISVI